MAHSTDGSNSVGIALLILTYGRIQRGGRTSTMFALSVAAKTFPIFVLPKLLVIERSNQRRLVLTLTGCK